MAPKKRPQIGAPLSETLLRNFLIGYTGRVETTHTAAFPLIARHPIWFPLTAKWGSPTCWRPLLQVLHGIRNGRIPFTKSFRASRGALPVRIAFPVDRARLGQPSV